MPLPPLPALLTKGKMLLHPESKSARGGNMILHQSLGLRETTGRGEGMVEMQKEDAV